MREEQPRDVCVWGKSMPDKINIEGKVPLGLEQRKGYIMQVL